MSRFGLAALAGLGSAAMGLPQGMDAAEKERLAQEDRLQRQQGIDLQRKAMERQESPVDVGALYDAIGMPRPADAPTSVDPRLASVYSQGILKRGEMDRDRQERQAAQAAIRGLAPTVSTSDSFGDVGGAVAPAQTVQRPSRQRIAETLAPFKNISPEVYKFLAGDEGVKLQGFGTDQDVYETPAGGPPRLVRPGSPKPKEPNQGERREALIDQLLVQKGYTPGTKEYNEQKFNAMRTIPVTEGGMVFGGGQMIPDRTAGGIPGQPGGPTPLAKGPQKPIEAAAAQLVVGGESARRAAEAAIGALNDPAVQQYIGPYAQYRSRIQRGAPNQALGNIPESVVALEQNLSRVKNYAIKLITGAQMSEPEAKRIMAELPDLGNQPAEFAQRMQATLANIEAMEARVNSLVTRGGVTVGPDAQNAAKPTAVWILRDTRTGKTRRYQPDPGETSAPAGYEIVR